MPRESTGRYSPVPKFEVNLDLPPEKRWDEVVAQFRDGLHEALTALEEAILPESCMLRSIYHVVILFCGLIVHPLPVFVLATALLLGGVSWSLIGPLVLFVTFALTSIPYRREVAGIARASGISPGKILLVQYVYCLLYTSPSPRDRG